MSGEAVIPFVLLFRGRTGSSYLMSAIRRHPQAHACGEELVEHLRKNHIQIVRDFLVGESAQDYIASGFKTKYSDIGDQESFAALLSDINTRIIVLERRNLVKQVVSFITGEQLYKKTGDWNLYNNLQSEPTSIQVELTAFDRELKKMENSQVQLMRFANQLMLPTLFIYYEELLIMPEEVFGWVTNFLSLPSHPFHSKTTKNTKDNLQDVIENFDELRSNYIGSKYECMFDEIIST
jgi:hypothetical protein